MTTEVIMIHPEATLAEASTLMADRKIKILPVTEDDNLHGVITRMDILVLHVLRPQRG
jgi:CBS domain-containing protein